MSEPLLRRRLTNQDDFRRRAYEAYANMRADAPIFAIHHKSGWRSWLVTRYDDVLAVLKDRRFIKSYRPFMSEQQRAQITPIDEFLGNNLLTQDPPDHTRLRTLVQKAFSPRLVRSLRPRVQIIADALIDAVEEAGQMELIGDFAFPLPIQVIAELLGIPSADRDRFRKWSDLITNPRPKSDDDAREYEAEMRQFLAYLAQISAQRRQNPRDDLLSAMVQAEEAGDRLSEIELYSMLMLLIVAGHETTVNLIGNGLVALCQHPDQLALLRENPELIAPAIEELLRFDSPVESSTDRYAAEDIVIGGQRIQRGDHLLVIIGSANRDTAAFGEKTDTLDIRRKKNPHLAFGHGLHYCLGAALARQEGEVAILSLLRRLPKLRLDLPAASLRIRPSLRDLLRGYQEIPLRWD